MASNSPSHTDTDRNGWRYWATRFAWLATILIPGWIGFSRALVGTAGNLSWVFGLTLGGLLLVFAVVTLVLPLRRRRLPSTRALASLWIAFGAGIILGAFLPDAAGGADSVVAVLFGEHFEGAASAISNPAAIIMGFCVILAAVFSALDSRPGGPVRTADEDEYQGTGHFPLLGEE